MTIKYTFVNAGAHPRQKESDVDMNDKIVDFLEGLVHGPCGSIQLSEYEKWVRHEAANCLADIANDKLERAGAYGRTIDRWWDGFYTNRREPTVAETAKMDPATLSNLIATASRRG